MADAGLPRIRTLAVVAPRVEVLEAKGLPGLPQVFFLPPTPTPAAQLALLTSEFARRFPSAAGSLSLRFPVSVEFAFCSGAFAYALPGDFTLSDAAAYLAHHHFHNPELEIRLGPRSDETLAALAAPSGRLALDAALGGPAFGARFVYENVRRTEILILFSSNPTVKDAIERLSLTLSVRPDLIKVGDFASGEAALPRDIVLPVRILSYEVWFRFSIDWTRAPGGSMVDRTVLWSFEHIPATVAEAQVSLAEAEDVGSAAFVRLCFRNGVLGEDANLAILETTRDDPVDAVYLRAYSFSDGKTKAVVHLRPTDTIADARAALRSHFNEPVVECRGSYVWWANLRGMFSRRPRTFADSDPMSRISPARVIRVFLASESLLPQDGDLSDHETRR
jgi:hypothetical protein